VKIELLSSHPAPDDFEIFLEATHGMVHGNPMPFCDGRVGYAYAEQKAASRSFVESHGLKPQGRRRPPKDVVYRGGDLHADSDVSNGTKHERQLAALRPWRH